MNKNFLFICLLFSSINSQAQNWQQVLSGSFDDLNAVSYGSATHVYVTGFSPTILKSTDGGSNWTSLSTSFIPAGSSILACDFVSQDTGVVVGGDSITGFIYKTSNGGSSWTPVLTGASALLTSVMFPSSQVGYAIGGQLSNGVMYKTVNGGNTWTQIYTSGFGIEYNTSVHFANDNDGHMVGLSLDPITGMMQGQTLKVSSSGPATPVLSPTYFLFTDVFFRSADTGYVTALDFNGSYILKTTNGGANWTSVYSNFNEDVNTISFVDAQLGYAAGSSGLILKTTNGGSSWSPMTTPVSDDLASVEFYDSNSGIIVGGAGSIIKTVICTGIPTAATLNVPPACAPVTINGQTYSTSGSYTQLLTNAAGCDSVLTIVVVINAGSTTLMNQTACQSYSLNGQTYTMSGMYTQNYTNTAGCDSNIQLNLTVIAPNINVTQLATTLIAAASGVSYQWISCSPFTVIAGATAQSFTPIVNGSYAVIITQGTCKDTSACKTAVGLGVDDLFNQSFTLSPNPSQGKFILESALLNKSIAIKVMNLYGQILIEIPTWKGGKHTIDLSDQPKGIYFISVKQIDGVDNDKLNGIMKLVIE